MNLTTIEAKTLPEAWFLCIKELLDKDIGVREYVIDRGSFVGRRRREFDYITIHLESQLQ